MKIDIYVPTGEVRPVKLNDWYYCDNMWFQWINNNISIESYPIGIRHQIEVPDDSNRLSWFISNNPHCVGVITIPRPKKVKKWLWEAHFGKITLKTDKPYSEKDMRQEFFNMGSETQWHTVEGTEIEVEI